MPSPIMAGGLFSIDRARFWELGGYDPEMSLYGGEEMEISLRLWFGFFLLVLVLLSCSLLVLSIFLSRARTRSLSRMPYMFALHMPVFDQRMCGSTLECIPCSRVGHIFRTDQYYKGRVYSVPGEIIVRNKLRAAQMWMHGFGFSCFQTFPIEHVVRLHVNFIR